MAKTKEEQGKMLKTEEKAKKYDKELNALDSAYKSGLISEQSYTRQKERIEKELKKMTK